MMRQDDSLATGRPSPAAFAVMAEAHSLREALLYRGTGVTRFVNLARFGHRRAQDE